jgi:hypothetical protein
LFQFVVSRCSLFWFLFSGSAVNGRITSPTVHQLPHLERYVFFFLGGLVVRVPS